MSQTQMLTSFKAHYCCGTPQYVDSHEFYLLLDMVLYRGSKKNRTYIEPRNFGTCRAPLLKFTYLSLIRHSQWPRPHNVSQKGFKLVWIFLPQPPEY